MEQKYFERLLELVRKAQEAEDIVKDGWLNHIEGYVTGGLELFKLLEEKTEEK